jgi:CheY-like chemotaxis protein/signal transduction histidine kinase/HAMP domain-containing protein
LGGQANVPGVSGSWADLTGNVNFMAQNLTSQVRDIATVVTAVAQGDLSQKVTFEAQGEVQELTDTINSMVDTLNIFAEQVTNVATEVGTEGVLGGSAEVPNAEGTWLALTNSVNNMASNLTTQVRGIVEVVTGVAQGDLTQTLELGARGEIAALQDTVNNMVAMLNVFAEQVTTVAQSVGVDGVLGGQARIEGVEGSWRDLTDNVNLMAGNLTSQVRNISEVTTAVAQGDLTRRIEIDARGEVAELRDTINSMVDQLSTFSDEVSRVAREVGTEGILGGQANVPGVSGSWADLTGNVNFMAQNLTSQVRDIATVVTAVAQGDLSQKVTFEAQGEVQELTDTINSMVDTLNIFAEQVTNVATEVGTEGVLGGSAEVPNAEGTWLALTNSVNNMASNLTTQVRGIVEVVTGIANGDLTQTLELGARGEIAALQDTVNNMVAMLNTFADEVTNVARTVGFDGVLGGQANVPDAEGTWRDLTDNVNNLAENLTTQVRAITEVAVAVAAGDLTQTVEVETQGEVSALKDNVNMMVSNMNEVVRQANVIADGDYKVDIAPRSERDELGQAMRQMTINLRDADSQAVRNSWIQDGLVMLNDSIRGEQQIAALANSIIREFCNYLQAPMGALYIRSEVDEQQREGADLSVGEVVLRLVGSFAYTRRKGLSNQFRLGESVVGQAALEEKPILLSNVPEDYVKISSGLGESTPNHLLVVPFLYEGEVRGVIEIASIEPMSDDAIELLERGIDAVGIAFEGASRRTELDTALKDSQTLTEELQTQQEELQETNEQLEEQTQALETSRKDVEERNRRLEAAQDELNERAEQLAQSSKYKSEFLANMSHELRTPLNSIMMLSKMIANKDVSDEAEQLSNAQVIHDAGNDLLNLINEVLDLSKIEAGKMTIHLDSVDTSEFINSFDALFKPQAREKGLKFEVEVETGLPGSFHSDRDRLQQVLRNFLSNALKFTSQGGIVIRAQKVSSAIIKGLVTFGTLREALRERPHEYMVFSVSDSGLGIPQEKRQVVFEAFQQVDGTTSRTYGGTGLGLSISSQIAEMLEGALSLQSSVDAAGHGSTFSIVIPIHPSRELEERSVESESQRQALQQTSLQRSSEAMSRQLTAQGSTERIRDDQSIINPEEERILLVVEDDPRFAQTLLDLGRKHDFKVVYAGTGTEAIRMAEHYLPSAILLDIQLPIMDGWAVLRYLKKNPSTSHIPVHILSVLQEEQFGYRLGAAEYLVKPVDPEAMELAFEKIETHLNTKVRNLLVVEDNDIERESIIKLLSCERDVNCVGVATGKEALEALRTNEFDAFILDLRLPDMSGYEILQVVAEDESIERIPTIVYTGKDLSMEEEQQLRVYAESVVLKTAESPARLLEETTIFLHRVRANLSEEKQQIISELMNVEEQFKDRTVLLVDDDVRNTYVLSLALQKKGLNILTAGDGQKALEMLKENADLIDIVLMDIMMPVMDGYDATRAIRKQKRFEQLPVIALTAKALKEDRDLCIAAGASDYMTKPIDYDQLFSLIRVWLSTM